MLIDQRVDPRLSQLSEFIAEKMGLHFPHDRWPDLQRGLAGAAAELGFQDLAHCADWLMTGRPTESQLKVVARHLTVGETYFLRERKTFDVLASRVLPDLVDARRGRHQRLRLWSAACASGEEAYSLAILLHQVLPDLAAWHVTILATDINPHFLQKAVAGSYGEWSFRGVPSGFKERYFDRDCSGRYVIRPEIRKLVTFEHLNLADDVYPSLATGTTAIDVIFCRNVLMYFTPAQIGRVVGKLHQALAPGGWLAVSPSEASHVWFPQFVTRNFPGVILYQKRERDERLTHAHASSGVAAVHSAAAPPSPPAAVRPATAQPVQRPRQAAPGPPPAGGDAASLYEQGRYAEAVDVLMASSDGRVHRRDLLSLLVRALANLGRLSSAREWCDRWIADHKLDAAMHYLRAVVLIEDGQPEEARRSLRRTVYLDPDFVLAHFALGNLGYARGYHDDANKHYAHALHLLGRLQPHDLLPESDGLTAGRLTEMIGAVTAGRMSAQRPESRHTHG